MDDPVVKDYRTLVGGGKIAYVRYRDEWIWRYRPDGNPIYDHHEAVDWPDRACSTIAEFAEKVGRTIDHEEYVRRTLPAPRRREAVMATKAKHE